MAAESITEVVEYIERLDSFEECKKLVVTISKNRLLDRFRQRATLKHGAGKVESLEAKEGFDAVAPAQQQPDALGLIGENALILAEALKQVPEKYRKVVEDFYLKGQPSRKLRIGMG